MSTKIWTAFRTKPGVDVWQLIPGIRRHAEKNIKARLVSLYQDLITSWKTDSSRRQYAESIIGRPISEEPTPVDASDVAHVLYTKQRSSSIRDAFDLDVSVSVRRAGRRYLLIPYPGSGIFCDCLTFLNLLRELEDFHYQNQTDRPETITARQWAERRRTWAPFLRDDNWQDQLVLSIVNGPSDLRRLCPSWDPKGPFMKALLKKD